MISLLELLKVEALERGLVEEGVEIDAAGAFALVRDMPYIRASSREPETIIREWRGTCSGKHYLLKALFAELGMRSRVIACTTVEDIDPQTLPDELRRTLEKTNGRFVDVHNYLILELEDGEMIVDATWPITTEVPGFKINESFVLGEDHHIAADPLQTWDVPEDGDPQDFKNELLRENFTPEELESRDAFIKALSVVLGKMAEETGEE